MCPGTKRNGWEGSEPMIEETTNLFTNESGRQRKISKGTV
jgi:hypothetical protein